MIDGEGSISDNPTWIAVTVSNTDAELMVWLKAIGGGVRTVVPQSHDEFIARKPCYHWRLTGTLNVLLLLRAVEPYLIVKRAKAQKLIRTVEAIIELRGHARRDAWDGRFEVLPGRETQA